MSSLGVSLGEVGFILQEQGAPAGFAGGRFMQCSRLESSREAMGLSHPLLILLLHTHAHACVPEVVHIRIDRHTHKHAQRNQDMCVRLTDPHIKTHTLLL